jgi:hypothetical protein
MEGISTRVSQACNLIDNNAHASNIVTGKCPIIEKDGI